jgi:hypothetical protein
VTSLNSAKVVEDHCARLNVLRRCNLKNDALEWINRMHTTY